MCKKLIIILSYLTTGKRVLTQLKANIFDVDGALAETERDGHRIAFNTGVHIMRNSISLDELQMVPAAEK